MEAEREKMRQGIRDKYKIQKKEEGGAAMDFTEGRIGAPRKTPEARFINEIAASMNAEDDSIIGQLGLTEQVERAKTLATGAFETVKGFLPFGK
ncbi:synaphin protein [Oesophagostomum dentatum]|uniref:Synaphin protein n=1 Tax=Oesophagostomum dentatum TaxID=61180 RepID=A0A0B1TFS4_OESDE|nr:synaphin protein [Oesophagostomum dentatum]